MLWRVFQLWPRLCSIVFTWVIKIEAKAIGTGTLIETPCKLYHPQHVSIGRRTRISRFGFILPVKTYAGVSFAPALKIGDDVYIGHNVHLVCCNNIEIHDEVLIADRVFIADNIHGHRDLSLSIMHNPLEVKGKVSIGRGAWLGENVCIIGNVTVGAGAIVAANAVVTKDVAPYAIVGGIPAKVIGSRQEKG